MGDAGEIQRIERKESISVDSYFFCNFFEKSLKNVLTNVYTNVNIESERGKHKRKGDKDMTKKEIAKAIATQMNKINSNVSIERMTKVLAKSMTTSELESALRGYETIRQLTIWEKAEATR